MSSTSSSTKTIIRQLKEDTEAICLPQGRKVGSPGHEKVRKILVERLEEIGGVPFSEHSFELPYHRNGTDFCNIVGVIPGHDRELPPLLVGAHYDSVIHAPCADDNAAAVAIALSVGALVNTLGGLERDLIIAIFDAEEPPYFQTESMGSRRFWHDQRGDRPIHAAVIMDLVGHDVSIHSSMLGNVLDKIPGLGDRDIPLPFLHPLLFMTGSESHPDLPDVVETAGVAEGLKLVPTLNSYVGDMSDHGVFRENGVPYFFLSCGHWEHYHRPTDTPDRLNYKKMERITRQVLLLLTQLDQRELPHTSKREKISDTLEFEAAHMRRAFGPLWPILLRRARISGIECRKDMDELVASILRLGL